MRMSVRSKYWSGYPFRAVRDRCGVHWAGIGHALLRSALSWFAMQGLCRASVVTQGCNVAALSLYERGFCAARVELYYHKWYLRERLT